MYKLAGVCDAALSPREADFGEYGPRTAWPPLDVFAKEVHRTWHGPRAVIMGPPLDVYAKEVFKA